MYLYIYIFIHRLLKDQPKVHHAVHLATIRKQCEENPLKILKKYPKELITTTTNILRVIKLEKELRFDDLDHIDDDDVNYDYNTTNDNDDCTHYSTNSNNNWSNLFHTQNKASKFMIHEKTNDN